jgi:hypothetical protein
MIITAVATVSLAAPSAALAHNGEHHRAGERHHHHRGHHRHAHVLAFHAQAPASANSGTTSPGSAPATEDKAGTIASFTGGVLTITLNDGSTVSGKVTERTEIECPAPSMSASAADFSGQDGGDDNGFDGRSNDGSGESGPSDGRSGDGPGHDDNGQDDNGQDAAEHCTSAALVPGASVKEAFLSVGGEGATWVKVEL